jgi:hypothetical protein
MCQTSLFLNAPALHEAVGKSYRLVQGNFVNSTLFKNLSSLCFVLGFASIIGSIAIWFLTGGELAETKAHAERFGIFVGLWAPTFFALSGRLRGDGIAQ